MYLYNYILISKECVFLETLIIDRIEATVKTI
jgi:hypothetical protein